MTIVVDENIPEAEALFSPFGRLRLLEGRAIDRAAVADADVLLVRSVTRVDRAMVEGTTLRFVGSATIGTDHVDQEVLRERNITFAHAPGSNATSVAEYVTAALFEHAVDGRIPLAGKVLGVVGFGNIGRRVARRAQALDMSVLVNDPPLADASRDRVEKQQFVPLDRLLQESDVVTLHVPYTVAGPYPTRRLIGAQALHQMKPDAMLINTSRGGVVDGADLLAALDERPRFRAVLDVFEREPTPDPALVQRLFLATPHIAGYSFDGKLNGAIMLYRALCRHLGVADNPPIGLMDDETFDLRTPRAADATAWLGELVRQMYDVRRDDRMLREAVNEPDELRGAHFNRLRRDYPRRRSFDHYRLDQQYIPVELREAVRNGLCITISNSASELETS